MALWVGSRINEQLYLRKSPQNPFEPYLMKSPLNSSHSNVLCSKNLNCIKSFGGIPPSESTLTQERLSGTVLTSSDQSGVADSYCSTDSGHVHEDGSVHICVDFIRGQCGRGDKCPKHHCPLPYQWQYAGSDDAFVLWENCEEGDNETLERAFCDPNNDPNMTLKLNR